MNHVNTNRINNFLYVYSIDNTEENLKKLGEVIAKSLRKIQLELPLKLICWRTRFGHCKLSYLKNYIDDYMICWDNK